MKGINKAILVGNSGKDVEYRILQDGMTVARFALATTETFRLKNGEVQSKTAWHTIILWRRLADFAHQYIRKGSHLYVEGKIQYRPYEDK